MVTISGGKVLCGLCGSDASKEAGYFECHVCHRWRFYGEPDANPYNTGCENCGTVFLNCLHQCPVCGAPNEQ